LGFFHASDAVFGLIYQFTVSSNMIYDMYARLLLKRNSVYKDNRVKLV